MKKQQMYVSDNGVISVKPNMTDNDELAYITIYAGSGKVHINAGLVDELLLLLATIVEDYELIELTTGNPTK